MPGAAEILAGRIEVSGDMPFITGLDGRAWSYADYWSKARGLAAAWREMGAEPGDVIAFRMANDVLLPCCYLSCAVGGFVACPIADNLHAELVDHVIRTVRPRLVIERIPEADAVAGFGEIGGDASAPFVIMFTSGSTGLPKPICHSLDNVVGSAAAFARLTNMSADSRFYHILPMAYMAGFLNGMLAPFTAGGHIVAGPLFSPESALDFWRRPLAAGVNTLQLTPTIAAAVTRMTRGTEVVQQVRERIVQVQCTSAPIALDIRHKFMDKFGVPLQDCYGITELGGPLTFQDAADAADFNDFTRPAEAIELQVRRNEDRDELWIRSPFAMLGYPEDDGFVRPFDASGFMDTGDLASLVQGRMAITGRKKDIIIRGGVNVSPVRVESVLSLMPEVGEVAVIGAPHPFWGEQIVACVVPEGDAGNLGEKLVEKVQAFARQHLGPAERPDTIRVMEKLPRSFIGKILKNELRIH